MKKIMIFLWKWLVIPLIGLAVILISVWSVCAIYFAKAPAHYLRITAAAVFILSNIAVFLNAKKRWHFLIFFAATFIAVLIWWSLIPPSNDRNWAEQTAVLPYAVFSNNFVTVHNVRNFDYKSEKEFTTNYYTRTYDLDKLQKLYLVVSYWDNNRAIAHTMLDFEFESGDCLVLSVEVRREKGEEYSANCTLSLIHHFASVEDNKTRFYLAYLLNGFLDWRLYENGVIDTELPAKEAKQAYYISDIARKVKNLDDFSHELREHLPANLKTSTFHNAQTKIKNGISRNKSFKIGATDWTTNFTSMSFCFDNGKLSGKYPDQMLESDFPPAGEQPFIKIEKKWPNVFINAKWSIDISNRPNKNNALDEILLRACNPNYYKEDFPETIVSTKFTPPPEFLNESSDSSFNFAKAMRGKSLDYEVIMDAGFGALDYTIKTKIYIGSSSDERTIFYYDCPEQISNHLDVREFIFAARESDDKIYFEVNIYCKCEPSSLLRGTKMNRVANDSKYFITQLYKRLVSSK